MFGAFHVRRIVPFVLAAVFTLLLLPALLIAAQEPTPTATPPQPPGTPLPLSTEPAVIGARLYPTPASSSAFQLLFTDLTTKTIQLTSGLLALAGSKHHREVTVKLCKLLAIAPR